MSTRRCGGWRRWWRAGAPPAEVFEAVTGEVGRLVGADEAALRRYETTARLPRSVPGAEPCLSSRWDTIPPEIFGEVASLLLMITGIVITAQHAPQVSGRTATERTGEQPAPQTA
jgi:hypothetical protein